MVQKIYWFTGQPGAGKTTLAKGLMNRLSLVNFIHVDGDDIRDIFQNKDYSENGRRQNIQRAQDIAQFLNAKGNSVIVSLVSPYKDQRDNFKQNPNVVEIYVHTDEIRGREQFHVQNYEPPTENFIEINTTNTTVEECVEKIIKYVGSVHLKDTDGKPKSFDFPPLGDGVVDFPGVFRLLNEAGFYGPWTFELEATGADDMPKALEKSVNYLKKMGCVD